ncbi:MAG: hypothetical protein AUJ97_06460 [Bacteroidetes bacterium CG2_30_32_10]|nr:MAG: hypothetical protein AUJ97_06460 [Bacteroidetes bacterium CG2_30_32_10]
MIKKINLFALIALATLLFACSSDEDKKNPLTITNDIDQMVGWVQHPTIIKGDAHSGKYMIKVDSILPYGLGLYLIAEDFPTKIAKSINASIWGKLTKLNDSISLVIDLSSKGQSITYNSSNFNNYIKKTGEWEKVDVSINIPKNLPLDATLKIYIWDPQKTNTTAFGDDFEITFIE